MKRPHKLNSRAVTLIEIMLAATIMSIIVVAAAPMFKLTQSGFTSIEAHAALKNEGQDAINKISHKLVECKRLFENTAADNAFLARAQFTGVPGALAGSQLPRLEETGSLSPSSGAFVTASVGNRLFFASVIPKLDVDAADAASVVRTVRIDQYVFNAYQLGEDPSKQLAGQATRHLWEWRSVAYADYNQLAGIPDATRRANAVTMIVSSNVTRAWDSSAVDVNNAFYTLDNTGAMTLDPTHQIAEADSGRLMRITTGITGGGYRYGISPNTGLAFETAHPVPRFAAGSGSFPSGFEVVVVGPNSARNVFMRLVLAAQGSFSGNISSEQVSLVTVRDLW